MRRGVPEQVPAELIARGFDVRFDGGFWLAEHMDPDGDHGCLFAVFATREDAIRRVLREARR